MTMSFATRSGYCVHRMWNRAFFLFVCIVFVFHLESTSASPKGDYLTEEEIEQLREAQEPPIRMNIFVGILNKRFEKVRLASTSEVAAKEEITKEDPDAKVAAKKEAEPKSSSSNPKEGGKKEPPASLKEILDVYLNCLDEVSANIENSHSLPMNPKDYLKSLNKLDGSLQKQNQWFKALEIKSLKKVERETIEEIVQAQRELAEDLEKTIDQLIEEIKKMKDANKAKGKKE